MALAVSSTLTIPLVIAILLLILTHYLKKIHQFKIALRLPGPSALPLIGNAFDFIGNTEGTQNNKRL